MLRHCDADADSVARLIHEGRQHIAEMVALITDAQAAGHPTASGELALSGMITAQAIMLELERLIRADSTKANRH
jgi:hypothetical protein